MIKLTVWMNMPSPYQVDLYRSLVGTGRVDLEVIYARELGSDRRGLGWSPEFAGYRSTTLPARGGWRRALSLARQQSDRFHIVNGIWAEPAFLAGLLNLARARTPLAIYAEAPNPTLPRPWLKTALRHRLGRSIAARARGVLAVSRFARDFYGSIGFTPEQIYPFGYFRAAPSTDAHAPAPEQPPAGRTHLVFIGQIIERKGVLLLWDAVQPLLAQSPRLSVTFVGEGSQRTQLLEAIARSGWTDRVTAPGAQPYDRVYEILSHADALVLPSRWDGWGLVVNEALAAGVPVIVSDHCGASDLIREGVNGFVVPAGSVEALQGAVERLLAHPDRPGLRASAAATGRAVTTEAVADYLVDCVEHMTTGRGPKPRPPWQAS